jgi:hypothetical protein
MIGCEIILRVFEIILRVREGFISNLVETLDGFSESAANAAVLFGGVDIVGND